MTNASSGPTSRFNLKKPLLLALVLLVAAGSGYGVFARGLQAPLPLAASVTVQVIDPPVEVAPTGAAQAPRGTPISYEIQADNVTDLAAAQVTFTYEKTLFSFVDVALGTEFDGCLNVFNSNVDGEVQLGLVCQTGHTGGPLTLWTVTLNPYLISPELEQAVNSQVGVTDVTLGNLAEQNISAQGAAHNVTTTFVCGDVHPQGGGNGAVDVLDALLTLKIAVGLVTPDAREKVAGDVDTNNTPDPDGDLDIDVLDALRVLKNSVGLGDDLASCGGPVPAPDPVPAPVPPNDPIPSGTINHGVRETGVFEAHPRFMSSPRTQCVAVSAGESLVTINQDFSAAPFLSVEWAISQNGQVWTWKIRDDVQFHKGYGTMTVHDILYSMQQYHEGALNPRATVIGDFWVGNQGGSQTVVDDFTVVVDTGVPWVQERAFEFMRGLGGISTSIVSKKQSDELTPTVASKDIAMTGPWEIVGHSSGEFWKFTAVQDHWRQTPFFQTLVLWTIPEESARVAGFQTGQLDSFEMSFSSLPTVEAVAGASVVSWPNAGQAGLNIYGQTYGTDKDGNPYTALDCTQAWVSCNEDPASAAWADAVKVKKAMAIAIDRQAIVDTLLSGFGKPLVLRDWMGHEARANPAWTFPFDPDAARSLLVDAGFPDGFSITLTPAIRGAPAEIEACEAVAQYWEDIGINVQFQIVPYATLRPSLVTRQYQGATCHTVGPRLTPIIGASNYVKESRFSYGTEHPWMQEHITAALSEADPVQLRIKELEVYDWFYDNVMAFGLYSFSGLWPVGPNLDPVWTPIGFSQVRTITGFEYIKHSQ